MFDGLGELVLDLILLGEDLKDKGHPYRIEAKTVEVFELSNKWKGTVRSSGAGRHISTQKIDCCTNITLSKDKDIDSFRKEFRRWVGKNFSNEDIIPKDCVKLNANENCLSVEGYAKKVNNKWRIVFNTSDASNYIAIKINAYDKNNILERAQLNRLFVETKTFMGAHATIVN